MIGLGDVLLYGQIPDFQWVVECSNKQKPRAWNGRETWRNRDLKLNSKEEVVEDRYIPASVCDKVADCVHCHHRPSPSSCRCPASARSASQPRRQSRSESTGSCDQNSVQVGKTGGIICWFSWIRHMSGIVMLVPPKKHAQMSRQVYESHATLYLGRVEIFHG